MAKVQANYLLSFNIPNETFVLDDSTRAKSNVISGDADLLPSLVSGENGGTGVYFEYNNEIVIRRARVDSVGAPGLQRPYNGAQGYAAIMAFKMLSTDGNNTDLGTFKIRVPDYNKWFECEVHLRPFSGNANPAPNVNGQRPVKLQIKQVGTQFEYDGLNMDNVYVGESWNPVIMFDVETPGVYDSYTSILI